MCQLALLCSARCGFQTLHGASLCASNQGTVQAVSASSQRAYFSATFCCRGQHGVLDGVKCEMQAFQPGPAHEVQERCGAAHGGGCSAQVLALELLKVLLENSGARVPRLGALHGAIKQYLCLSRSRSRLRRGMPAASMCC